MNSRDGHRRQKEQFEIYVVVEMCVPTHGDFGYASPETD